LTLQTPQYIYDALKAYATGQRQSGIMWPLAANLTDEEMRLVASRIGSAPPIASNPDEVMSASTRGVNGQPVALAGLSPNAAPKAESGGGQPAPPPRAEGCAGCHIADKYIEKVIPLINGQHAAYLSAQLHVFRDGGRGDTASYDPMVATSHKLTDSEITAVAAYYASLPPQPKTAKLR